jgi:hypothetical protein
MRLASRQLYNPQSLWLLTGLASRKGQIIGLHRGGSLRGLSPFETEMRRRLWSQILILDSRSAQLSGVTIDSQLHLFWDTKRPLNVNDSDLSQSMRELPQEHDGLTEMLFCSIRAEIGDCMRRLRSLATSSQTGRASTAQKERAVDELENRLGQRFLKKCDPYIPLHLLATYLVRSSICSMRLSAHHPRQHSGEGAGMSQEQKDTLFALALQVIVYDNLAYSTKSLEGYLWHVSVYFGFEAFILVLTELTTRLEGEAVDRAWAQISQVYENHPILIMESRNALYYAMGNLTLKAWDRRISAVGEHQPSHLLVDSPFISRLRAQRVAKSPPISQTSYPDAIRSNLQADQDRQDEHHQGGPSPLEMTASVDFPIYTPDWDWDCLQSLLDGRGNPFCAEYEPHSGYELMK